MVQNGVGKCKRKNLSAIEEKTNLEDEAVYHKEACHVEHPEPSDFPEVTKESNAYHFVPVVDKPVNTTWNKAEKNDQLAHSKDYFPESPHKASVRFRKTFLSGIMAVVTGIVTMVRLTKNMPKKIAAVTQYGESAVYYGGTMMEAAPTTSIDDHTAMMTRMAELEEKVNVLNMRPDMPPEKEELLNNALSRVTTLEQELASSKKTLDDALAKQVELQAYIDKKKKKKKKKLFGFQW